MLQDIAPHQFSRTWDGTATPEATDIVLAFCQNTVLSQLADGSLTFPSVTDVVGADSSTLTWGFTIDDTRFWLWTSLRTAHAPGFSYESVNHFRTTHPKRLSFSGITGRHLARWYENTRYCGHCGSVLKNYNPERARICPHCGHLEFPRISPAVIIGVTDGAGHIVVSRYANKSYKGTALIAGFIEVGETPEDAVRREVAEEVGLKVTNIRYAGSQPWGMDGDLLLGYFCDVTGNTSLNVDTSELACAAWVGREELEIAEPVRTLTNDMMRRFKNGLESEIYTSTNVL